MSSRAKSMIRRLVRNQRGAMDMSDALATFLIFTLMGAATASIIFGILLTRTQARDKTESVSAARFYAAPAGAVDCAGGWPHGWAMISPACDVGGGDLGRTLLDGSWRLATPHLDGRWDNLDVYVRDYYDIGSDCSNPSRPTSVREVRSVHGSTANGWVEWELRGPPVGRNASWVTWEVLPMSSDYAPLDWRDLTERWLQADWVSPDATADPPRRLPLWPMNAPPPDVGAVTGGAYPPSPVFEQDGPATLDGLLPAERVALYDFDAETVDDDAACAVLVAHAGSVRVARSNWPNNLVETWAVTARGLSNPFHTYSQDGPLTDYGYAHHTSAIWELLAPPLQNALISGIHTSGSPGVVSFGFSDGVEVDGRGACRLSGQTRPQISKNCGMGGFSLVVPRALWASETGGRCEADPPQAATNLRINDIGGGKMLMEWEWNETLSGTTGNQDWLLAGFWLTTGYSWPPGDTASVLYVPPESDGEYRVELYDGMPGAPNWVNPYRSIPDNPATRMVSLWLASCEGNLTVTGRAAGSPNQARIP